MVKLGISPAKLQKLAKSAKVLKIGIWHHKNLSTSWGNMATNTSGIVYPSDSDYSDYQSEVQNVAQQVIHFIDNNVPLSDNESLNNDSSDNLWTVKMAKMEMEISCKYQFQTIKIQNLKQIWNGMGMDNWFWSSAKCWTFPWRRNDAHGSRKELTPSFLWRFLSLRYGTILSKKLTYAETRITQRCK